MTFKLEPLQEKSVFFNNQRKPVTRSDREKGEYPYYGAAGIQDYVSEYIFDGRYILVGEDGTVISNDEYPVVQIAEGKFWVNNHAHVIRPTSDEDFDFLYYVLVGSKVKNLVTGAVQPKLSMTNLKSLLIPWPENAEVRRGIGKTLSILDKKIQANNAVTETLENISQTLFRSWFVDFDPVRAKVAGENLVGMDEEISSLLPSSFADSEIGPIPSGWSIRGLDEISNYLNGLAMQKFPVVDESNTLPVIKIAQLRAGNTIGADVASGLLDRKYVIKDGDILFSWSGTLEVEMWAGGPGALNQHLFKVTGATVPDWFAFLSTRHHLSMFRAIASGKATTMGHIQRGHLSEAKIAVPTKELLEAVQEIIQPLLDLKLATLVSSRTLVELRNSLLPRLVSGELLVPKEMLA